MEDDKVNNNNNNNNPMHKVYLANGMDINAISISNTKAFEPPSIFSISGNNLNSTVELVTDNKEEEEDDGDSDVISDLIGHTGPWQLFWAVLMCLYQFPSTFHIFCLVFQSATKDFWCARPDHLKSAISPEGWRNLTESTDNCNIIDAPYNSLDIFNLTEFISGSNKTFVECTAWEFDMSLIGSTIVSEWNIVCNKAYLRSVVESCFLAGAALGSVSSGWISDQYGRKPTLMAFATIQLVTGFLLGFCENIEFYMVGRVIIGFASMAVVVVSFVLCVEFVSGKWRTIIGILNILPVALAYIVCAFISYLTYNWRTMQFVISTPTFFLLMLWPVLPESPRWLLSRGYTDELTTMMKKAGRWNGISLPENFQKLLASVKNSTNQRVSILDLFKRGYRRTTTLMAVVWFAIILLYFGITLHMETLGGNIYVNVVMAGSVEAVSIIASVFVVLKLGLRINLVVYLFVAGIAYFFMTLTRERYEWLTIGLAMIVKITVGASNALIPTYTAHHYPVYMRNLGIGAGNLAAGFALVAVPYLFLLEHINVDLPMWIMGVTGVIGAIALLLIQEKSKTRATPTPQINAAFVAGN